MTIVFENHGTIDPRAITVMGVNVKATKSPVGFFGTGLKYAIAASLRLGFGLEIHTDGLLYTFSARDETIRGKSFAIVTMRCTKPGAYIDTFSPYENTLGFTTEFGKNWEPWMVYRELYSNSVLDEAGRVYELADGATIDRDPGLTRIVVTGLDDVHERRGEWFLGEDRKLLAETPDCQIFDGASTGVFYRGIRVHTLKRPGVFTYNVLAHLDLTEDRTAKYEFYVDAHIRNAIVRLCDKSLLQAVIRAPSSSVEGHLDYDDSIFTASHVSDEFVEAVAEASQSPEPYNRSALAVATRHSKATFLPKPRAPDDDERLALKEAFTALARVGIALAPVVIVEGVSGDGFAHGGKLWLTSRAFDGLHGLARRLLEFQMDLDAVHDRERLLADKLVAASEALGRAMAGAVVTLPEVTRLGVPVPDVPATDDEVPC